MTNPKIAIIRGFYLTGYSNIRLKIWQHLPFCTTVSLPWPGIDDPNNVWAPWLLANVGPHQLAWEWWLDRDLDIVKIRFLRRIHAAEFVLRFG